ncbi:MAG: transglutaminase [Piscirickettsiaceae bacterium]|nr:MAG: transglutaminase [Piscirickettsiaceae bacterium]
MNKQQPRNIQASLVKLLLVICALLIMPHINNLQPMFIAVAFGLLAWRSLVLWRPKAMPHKYLLLPISVALALLVLKTFGMSLGRDASSSLLIILMGLKLLESRTSRDIQAVIYMCFFVLITPFLFDQRIEIAAYALIVFFMLLFALVINNTPGVSLKNTPLLRLSGMVLLQAIPLMLVFFILFPRMIGPLWAMPDDHSAVSGLTDSINPGQISNLALSDKIAFRVRFKGPAPKQKDLYWRGPVFWETDGKAWTLTPPRKDSFNRAKPIPFNTADYQYTLMMEPHQQFWLYALDLPSAAPKNTRLTHDHQLILRQKLSRNLSFDLTSSTQARLKNLSEQDKIRALALPTNTDPRVYTLAKQWLADSTSDTMVINKALQFYNDSFYYTLRPPSLGKNPVAEFLFESKRGFCGHFATSFATLMRAADIPSRLVGGYQGGIYNKLGNFYTVRQADAHVWVEVWLGKVGWVRVDPTAAIAPNRIEHSIDLSQQRFNSPIQFLLTPPEGINKWLQELSWVVHSINYYWQNAVLAYGPEKQLDFLSNFGIGDWGDMVIWLASLSGLILLVSMGILFYIQRQRHDPVQKAYLSLCKKLSKKVGERQQHETASDYFELVIQQYPALSNELLTLRTQYLNTRYGHTEAIDFIASAKKLKFNA